MFSFTHIEKCGGTSFNEVLSLTYPRYFHVTKNKYGGNEIRNDLTQSQFEKIMFYNPSGIGGHSIRPYLEFLPETKRITFMRNPVNRYISQFNHLKETGWVSTIDEFLKNEFYYDFITKKIAGKNDYNLADKILTSFDFIGDTDEYNKSLNYLQDVLNVKLYGSVEHKNMRNHKSDYLKYSNLSTVQRLKVEENNQNDIELYEKFIIKSSTIKHYSNDVILRKPSKIRRKIIGKLNKYKKEQIINPIRLA